MIPFIFPLVLTIILLLTIFSILIKRFFSSNATGKCPYSVRYSYPSRTRQRDFKAPTYNPCINYVQRKSKYKEYFSDNDFLDDSNVFTYEKPRNVNSNLENQKGGFKYTIPSENKVNEENEKREHSPVLPTIAKLE